MSLPVISDETGRYSSSNLNFYMVKLRLNKDIWWCFISSYVFFIDYLIKIKSFIMIRQSVYNYIVRLILCPKSKILPNDWWSCLLFNFKAVFSSPFHNFPHRENCHAKFQSVTTLFPLCLVLKSVSSDSSFYNCFGMYIIFPIALKY